MGEYKTIIYGFLFNRIRNSVIMGLIISIIIFVFFGKNNFIQYWFGIFLGVVNFATLTIGLDLILRLKPLAAQVIHFLFFIFRYFAIALVIVLYIHNRNANVYIVVFGLLTMQMSLFVVETKKHVLSRKEG
jgi:hypothetical protein